MGPAAYRGCKAIHAHATYQLSWTLASMTGCQLSVWWRQLYLLLGCLECGVPGCCLADCSLHTMQTDHEASKPSFPLKLVLRCTYG